MTETLDVALGGRSYPILIGSGLLGATAQHLAGVTGRRRLVILTDANVAALHLAALERGLDLGGHRFDRIVIEPGEASKDVHRFPALLERLIGLGLDRSTIILAFGGGVVGDLAGFAAATLLRGLDFVQIPTTLLAQIDSSVGGKTGVNSRRGKNLIGAFHQPRLVLADLDLLATLPRRELLAGYAEMVKYGLLGDADFFQRLEREWAALLDLDPAVLGPAVAHCCRMKAAIVGEDEREAGRRALLNLGHTFGHALEAETGFGDALLHGESVALGMVLASDLSVRLGRLDPAESARIRRHLDRVGLRTRLEELPGHPFSAEKLLGHMAQDKKAVEGRLTFILLDGIGRGAVEASVDPAPVLAVLREAGAV